MPLAEIPLLTRAEFRQGVLDSVQGGAAISALFACRLQDSLTMYAVMSKPGTGQISVFSTRPSGGMDSLVPDCPQAQMFEREAAEGYGIEFRGHPWLKPVRYPPGPPSAETNNFFRIRGAEIHEVAVGPVHAGVIEPGHFRFLCHGETVYHLEIALGYQHRGVEEALKGRPDYRRLRIVETIAGDTSIGHATAYCSAFEALCGTDVPARAQVLRGVALELERMANHVGDLGAMAGDVGFLPTMSYCGRIRGDVLNITAGMCGNRFGRGLLRPGGLARDIDGETARDLSDRLRTALRDAEGAVGLLWETPSVLSRFEGTGTVPAGLAASIGLSGPAARASGLEKDVRRDFPSGIYRMSHIPLSVWDSGDVFARALVRWMEVQRSAAFILEQLGSLPDGPVHVDTGALPRNGMAVSLAEGWRGEICHVLITDDRGGFSRCKVVDPSFRNWFGLACALRGQQISDFPLCNKSFNLSYCGHDL